RPCAPLRPRHPPPPPPLPPPQNPRRPPPRPPSPLERPRPPPRHRYPQTRRLVPPRQRPPSPLVRSVTGQHARGGSAQPLAYPPDVPGVPGVPALFQNFTLACLAPPWHTSNHWFHCPFITPRAGCQGYQGV